MWARALNAFRVASLGTRLAVYAGILAIVAGLAFFAYSQIASSYERADARGYKRGKDEVTARWNAAQAEVARLNAEKADAWRKGGEAAVAAYIADQKARAPAVEAVTKERIVYVNAPENRVTAVDAGGVRLLQTNRDAHGIPASAAAAPAAR